MKQAKRMWKKIALLSLAVLWMFSVTAAAEDYSGDNSLYSLGLENASECSPEFYYSTLEYNVTVPKGTEELYLSPVTSDPNASVVDISGTILDENSNGTVYITVEASNGAQVSYVLYVTADGTAATEETTETEAATVSELEKEEELKKQAESEAAMRQEAEKKANEEKLNKLVTENGSLVERMDLLLKVLYGMVGFCVLLLFFIINQSLRNKDLKDDLKEARSQADMVNNEFARKEQNMRTDYYYAPVNGMNQNRGNGGGVQMTDVSNNVQAAFGNAPQKLQAQPMPGQAYPPTGGTAPMQEMPEQPLSKRDQKKMEKAAKKAEKSAKRDRQPTPEAMQAVPMNQMPQNAPTAPVMQNNVQMQNTPVMPTAPVQETFVQGSVEEPDVNVDMIDL